ncbi:MAG TPA: tetratricopeptide repeat protein [Nitrospiraceae bacterium]|nr:tetratricopeptide repeat protein [Nitrospiraceae bacterium]
MEADKSKILQNANQLAAKGQFDKAVAEWKKLLADAPNDGSIHNNIGDLHLKRNATNEAVDSYLQAGAAFQGAGSALKAIAVYKKVLKLDPSRYSVYQLLADLNAERGLVNNAISDYLTLSKLYLKDGRMRDALAVYRKVVDLDPTNLVTRQRLAELCLQENLRDEAIKAYFHLGKECVAQHEIEQAKKAYQAILKLDPGNARADRLLKDPKAALKEVRPDPVSAIVPVTGNAFEQVQQHIAAGQYDQADSMLSDLLSAQPGDPEVCRLLAMLHLKRGELGVALSEIQFLSEAAMRAEDYTLAESMILEYLKADAGCVSLLELLGLLYEQNGNPTAAVTSYGKAAGLLLKQPDPDAPNRPAELYAKMKTLDSSNPLIDEIAKAMTAPASAPEVVESSPQTTSGDQADPMPITPEPPAALKLAETRVPPVSVEVEVASPEGSSTAQVSAPEDVPSTAPLQMVPGLVPSAVATGHPHEQSMPATTSSVPVRTDHEYRVQYELGMAYKNMGMLPEAVEEFRLAMSGRECFLDAASMLSACLKEQGFAEPAMESLEQALSDPRCDKDRSTSIRYELGLLYEAEGLIDKAVEAFSTIPTFLDVPVRLERLKDPKSELAETDGAAGEATMAAANTTSSERKKRRISYL